MRIAQNVDVKLGIWDIETLKGLFDVGIYDPDTKEFTDFEISPFRNDLYKLVAYYTKNDKYNYWVSFNGIGFDHQVLQFIVNEHQNWTELDWRGICTKIHEFVQLKIFEAQKYKLPVPYYESYFPVKALDVFRIHHFDNEAKRTSLKWCEYMMDMDVEEMPIHHTQEDLTEEEIKMVKDYRKHDLIATLALLYITLGELQNAIDLIKEHFNYEVNLDHLEDYKGKNKIQDRFDVQKETGMDCLNWSDVKIGEEWNKRDYKIAEKIKDDSKLFTKKIKHPYGQKFKNFFPSTMKFTTPLFQDFIKDLGNQYVKNMKQEFTLKVGSTTYTIAKGGLHSTEKNREVLAAKGFKYTDIDVGSQYPNSIVKLMIYAPHLAKTILDQFQEKIARRLKYKKEASQKELEGLKEEARILKGLQEMLKLCLNGGYYGKLGQPGSFLEYPEGLLKVCMSNQIEILMLIEMMETRGFQVLSGNTDGITVYYSEDKFPEFLEICKNWEDLVGNHTMGKLEYTEFLGVWQRAVNSYIGRKYEVLRDGSRKLSVKKKGAFLTSYELNKKKTKRIIPLALEQYFIHGVDPIKFITEHKNIFDFTTAVKAFGQLHYEEISETEVKVHKKIVRYYLSVDGNILKKRGINNEGNPMDNHCEAVKKDFFWMGQPKVTYFNRFGSVKDIKDYNIDYKYYILETLEIIDSIQKTKKAKNYADLFKPQQQISMF